MAVAKRRVVKPKARKPLRPVGRKAQKKTNKRTPKLPAYFTEATVFASVSAAAINHPRCYALVTAELAENLVKEVQTRLNDGWTPFGGIAFSAAGLFCQAMVRN